MNKKIIIPVIFVVVIVVIIAASVIGDNNKDETETAINGTTISYEDYISVGSNKIKVDDITLELKENSYIITNDNNNCYFIGDKYTIERSNGIDYIKCYYDTHVMNAGNIEYYPNNEENITDNYFTFTSEFTTRSQGAWDIECSMSDKLSDSDFENSFF